MAPLGMGGRRARARRDHSLRLDGALRLSPQRAAAAREPADSSARLGHRVNSRGDYHEEPPAPGESKALVVVIGDSFGVGMVPLPLHYTSIAERELGDVTVYNLGVPAIGPPEYRELIQSEALPMEPDILLIPDEFQAEDALWRAIASRNETALERDRPQRLVREFCDSRGIPVLDLLPILRAVEPLSNGRRHLYHLADTHWNAHGNAAAGHALAETLRPMPAARGPSGG